MVTPLDELKTPEQKEEFARRLESISNAHSHVEAKWNGNILKLTITDEPLKDGVTTQINPQKDTSGDYEGLKKLLGYGADLADKVAAFDQNEIYELAARDPELLRQIRKKFQSALASDAPQYEEVQERNAQYKELIKKLSDAAGIPEDVEGSIIPKQSQMVAKEQAASQGIIRNS